MKFFFPDSQDLVDPSFDFTSEKRSATRLRQRDDKYAHEVFASPPFDGLLVSKGIVDGVDGGSSGKYTLAQRQRLFRDGARAFFRLPASPYLPIIGDCGAFTYVREKVPPFSVDSVITFYVDCGFDLGISVDHVILAFDEALDAPKAKVPKELKERQEITLDLADEFFRKRRSAALKFEPVGVAQGWSPASYAQAVKALQKIGYGYIALGGMVPLKTREILSTLEAIESVRRPSTRLHLLGVTRTDSVAAFRSRGVVSFDSTSPLRQAFKDDKDNYYTMDRTYTAIRVPQVDGNPSLLKRIRAGQIRQETAQELERRCRELLRKFDSDACPLDEVLEALREYEMLFDDKHDHTRVYREVLSERPWRSCKCEVCTELGHHVLLFRGAERNRRRGFHNVWVFYRRLRRELGLAAETPVTETRRTATTRV